MTTFAHAAGEPQDSESAVRSIAQSYLLTLVAPGNTLPAPLAKEVYSDMLTFGPHSHEVEAFVASLVEAPDANSNCATLLSIMIDPDEDNDKLWRLDHAVNEHLMSEFNKTAPDHPKADNITDESFLVFCVLYHLSSQVNGVRRKLQRHLPTSDAALIPDVASLMCWVIAKPTVFTPAMEAVRAEYDAQLQQYWNAIGMSFT